MKNQADALATIPDRAPHGKILTAVYLHSDKESMYEKGVHLGLTGEALDQFMYACYEVKVGLEVDVETGDTTIVSIDGRQVENTKK